VARKRAGRRRRCGRAASADRRKDDREHRTEDDEGADAVDLLTDDHLQVSALFKQYEKLAKKKAPSEQRAQPAARSAAC
jgi:hypothetical protein